MIAPTRGTGRYEIGSAWVSSIVSRILGRHGLTTFGWTSSRFADSTHGHDGVANLNYQIQKPMRSYWNEQGTKHDSNEKQEKALTPNHKISANRETTSRGSRKIEALVEAGCFAVVSELRGLLACFDVAVGIDD
jgi:hypothetical protein